MTGCSDGMFRMSRPAAPLPFTGERLTSTVSGAVEMEHLHRYCFARDLCVGRDVLDVASGEGYGASILAGVARSVIGVERDAGSVEHAQRAYPGENLRFELGDALSLPLMDDCVDVVVSFETLEHIADQARFLAEVKRVLRPGGLFVVSTPDRQVHSGLGMPVNPYHVLELSRSEFEGLLTDRFANVSILAQRTLVGSALLADGTRMRTYERRDAVTIEATGGVARAVYLVAVASDGPLQDIPGSIYADERSVDALLATIAQERHDAAKAKADCERLQQAEGAAKEAAERLRMALAEAERVASLNEQTIRTLAAVELDRIAADRDRIAADRNSIAVKLERIAAMRDRLAEDQARIAADRDNAATDRDRMAKDLERIAADRDSALADRDRIAWDRDRMTEDRDRLAAENAAIRAATVVRLGLYAARRANRLPAPVLRILRRTLGAALRMRGAHHATETPGAVRAPSAVAVPIGPRSATALLAGRYPSLEPFPCFRETYPRPRLSIVTDSVRPSSLFGGVGTSILLGAVLANHLGATLRIVTRTEPSDASPVRDVLANNGVTLDGTVEMAFAPIDGSRDLPVADGEVFLTTSWWNTRATLGSVPRDTVIALVQEDERMFYPHGDDHLRCGETLSEPGIPVVVNTELLFRHLADGRDALANLGRNGMWFEPAFPQMAKPLKHGAKRRLFFYARPHNLRNLFWRGIEVLDLAVAEGLFPPDRWEMFWVGRDIPDIQLPRGVVPVRMSGMAWGDYQSFIASMDAGFVLMDTPHPSYPPFDLAAAGAAVLTNTHPGKATLERYSRNILMAPPTRDGLLEGLRRLQELAEDDAQRASNRAEDGIGRDWAAALNPVVTRLARHLAG